MMQKVSSTFTEDIPVTFASTVKEGICFGKKSGANSILVHFIQRYYYCNALTVGTLCYCAQDRGMEPQILGEPKQHQLTSDS